MVTHTLAQLAAQFSLELKGEGSTPVSGVCTLLPGKPGCISFLSNPKLRRQLAETRAAAVIVGKRDAAELNTGLIAPDPYLAYARIARLFDPHPAIPGIHPTATVAPSARIGEGCAIGPGCVIGENAQIGAGSLLFANVFVWHGARIGARCSIQPGAVIGGRGFGNARGPQGWEEVPQLGSVVIGDDVEIGANTCIDRGAIEDTVIGDGVRLDNLIQVAHNVRIGAHTAIAACTGIAGSAVIGARCMIGGGVGINGHIEIADETVVLAWSLVTHSLTKGIYGGSPAVEAREWRRQTAGLRRLEKLQQRVRRIEQQLKLAGEDDGGEGDEPGA